MTKISKNYNLYTLNLCRGFFFPPSFKAERTLRGQLKCFYFKQAVCDKQAANVLLNVEFAERVCVVCPGAAARRDLLATAVRSGIPKDTHQSPKCYLFIGHILGALPLLVSRTILKIPSWKGAISSCFPPAW